MRHWKLLAILALLPLLTGCGGPIDPVRYDPITVYVVDETGKPLENAIVHSYTRGGDWGLGHYEAFYTDLYGSVVVDGRGAGRTGAVRLANYFPIDTIIRADAVYQLHPTPYQATQLAELEGDYYRFYGDGIISLTASGFYRYFPLDASGVKPPTSRQLQVQTSQYSSWLQGKELWLRDASKSYFRYDLTEPTNPVFINEYRFPSYSDRYAMTLFFGDDIILVSGMHHDLIGVFEVTADSLHEWSTFPTVGYPEILLRGRRVLLLSDTGMWGYDISDLRHPVEVGLVGQYDNEWVAYLDTVMVMRVATNASGDSTIYQVYDMHDPASPLATEQVSLQGRLNLVVDQHHVYSERDYRNDYYYSDEGCYLIRPPGSQVFGMAGYLTQYVSAAKGDFVIVGDMLYRWSSR